MERSQYHEHSSPLNITSSFVFEDAEDMRASFVEEKNAIFTAALQTPILRNLFRKLLKWKLLKMLLNAATSGKLFL